MSNRFPSTPLDYVRLYIRLRARGLSWQEIGKLSDQELLDKLKLPILSERRAILA